MWALSAIGHHEMLTLCPTRKLEILLKTQLPFEILNEVVARTQSKHPKALLIIASLLDSSGFPFSIQVIPLITPQETKKVVWQWCLAPLSSMQDGEIESLLSLPVAIRHFLLQMKHELPYGFFFGD